MQPTPQGKDVLDVDLTVSNLGVGEETCAVIETGLTHSGLHLLVNIGSRVVYSGPAPSSLEVCFTPQPGEEGKRITVIVAQDGQPQVAATAGARGKVHS